MSRTKKVMLGFATFWPLLYFLLFIAYAAANIGVAMHTGNDEGLGWHIRGRYIIGLHLLTMMDVAGLIAWYLAHLYKTERVPDSKKAFWAVVLLLASPFATIAYWILYIRKNGGEATVRQF